MITSSIEGQILTCIVDTATRTILVEKYCIDNISCSAGSVIVVKAKFFMQNSNWIKSPLNASDSFQIKTTLGNTSSYFVDGVIQSLVASPVLIENKVLFLTYYRSNDTINQQVSIQFGIKISDAISQTGKIYFTVPSLAMFKLTSANP